MRLKNAHRRRLQSPVLLAALLMAAALVPTAGRHELAASYLPATTQAALSAPASHKLVPAAPARDRQNPSTWSAPNGNNSNTRRVSGPINSRNVQRLSVAWSAPIVAPTANFPGGYSATPVVVDGVAYTQDLGSNVYAINVRTGKALWTVMMNDPDNGPNGVNVSHGRVFAATESKVFALDAKTGKQLWSQTIVRNDNEGIDMAPGVNNGTVYVSTVPGNLTKFYAGNGQAILWAIDAATGRTKWKWAEVPASLWGNPALNSGGGQWQPPGFDEYGNIYLGVANPAPFVGTTEFPYGTSRPGPNLYTDSVVKLDGRTGKLIWANQALPHDLYDWDMQDAPVLTRVAGRPVVLDAGKMGYVFEYDQRTGKLLWKTSVGKHNGHDNDNLLALHGELSKLPKLPFTLFPGALGGVLTQIAIDDTTVYAAVNDYGVKWVNQAPPPVFPPFSSGAGELVAINLVTGKIRWQHKFNQSPYGAATVTNDLVFTTTFDGKIYALNTHDGRLEWQSQLPAASNAPVAISGNMLLAGAGWPANSSQHAAIVAYQLKK